MQPPTSLPGNRIAPVTFRRRTADRQPPPSLRWMFATSVRAARLDMPRRLAICLTVKPSTSRSRTAFSLRVKRGPLSPVATRPNSGLPPYRVALEPSVTPLSWDRTRVPQMTFEDMEQALRTRLEALPPAARAELVHVLRLPDFDRVDRIGEFWASPETRTFGELLIDLEEDQAARPVVSSPASRTTPGSEASRRLCSSPPWSCGRRGWL
jgi:hypothetical protein